MSGPKRWVSAKVHRKSSSRSSLSSNHSSSPLDDRPHPSPPLRIPAEDTTAATTIVDFGSGSTLITDKSDGPAAGEPSTNGSNSSFGSISTGLAPSPSTTPPKKAWEKDYKSFLKRSGRHCRAPPASPSGVRAPVQRAVPGKPSPPVHYSQRHNNHFRTFSENATNLLPRASQHQPLFPTHEDIGPSLADGFGDHSQHETSDGKLPLTAPSSPSKHRETSSPSKHRETSTRGGAFFKRLRNKAKSSDSLDASMRKGVDRKSPTNTPPGGGSSASSTPIERRSAPAAPPGLTALQEGMEKAALLSELLSPPALTSPAPLGSHERKSGSWHGDRGGDSLDRARHRGHGVSIAPSATASQTPFSRVSSVGSNRIIPEREPVINDKNEREKRKAFTDFHNMGIDSSSAYLGDELSLHKHSVFLASMAYPAGSAGGKRHTFSQSGPRSLDHKMIDINSTSMSALSEKTPLHKKNDDNELLPERSLRALEGPEHWKKGERHAISPGVLCMCPIQVLNNIMSVDGGPSSGPSLASQGSQAGFGIGSVLSEDDGVDSNDSNGWFFADHHQPSTPGGMLPRHGSATSSNAIPSAFGKILLGKATVAPLGMRTFLHEVYGWCTGVFVLRQNYLFEYREGDSLNGLPWGFAQLPFAEAYPHNHFTNALHLEFFERPCSKSGRRSLLLRVESKGERDRWVSLLNSAARITMHDLYDVDESDGAPEFGRGRYAVVRPAKRKDWRRVMSFSDKRNLHATNSLDSFRNVSSHDSFPTSNKSSNTDLEKGAAVEYDCALKIIDKNEFWSSVKKGRERVDTLVREAAVQTTLAMKGGDTPGFLRLRNIFETGETLVLELELLKGTDLFQHVSSHGVLGEVEAAHIMRDLLNCLNVLDQVGIAHRDIKPANLLMCRDENIYGTKIKLADYGMASFVGVDNLVRGRCGTPGFVAPEILLTGVNGGYGNKVDMFSAGVTLYVMLSGYEPFYGESDAELIEANREAKVDFPHTDWHSVSIEGRDLIERMLVVDPMERIGPSEALRHPWITRRATPPQN